MPTIIESSRPTIKQPTKYFQNPAGRPKGSKNRFPIISFRREIEEAYKRMGGIEGLLSWTQSEEGKGQFYQLCLKLMATYELKEQEQVSEPIRIVVYGKDTTQAIEIQPAQTDEPEQLT